jgi:beta-galactosidase/beta-glucuronidase
MSELIIPRPEYPRPDLERTDWLNLNGEWQFDFDDTEIGEVEKWYDGKDFSKIITVPFCFQCEASGIQDKSLHEVMWYKRSFNIPQNFSGKRVFLNFGAVDYFAKVWINGNLIGTHKGGYSPFKFDITNFLQAKTNFIVVKVEDRYDTVQPRGKQFWKEKVDRCWYTATSGIWQTVWLEATGEVAFDRIRIIPDIDKRCATAEIHLDRVPSSSRIKLALSYNGKKIKDYEFSLDKRITKFTMDIKEEDEIDECHYWSPQCPNLYHTEFTLLKDNVVLDKIKTYFGMRKISVKGDMILLNNKPLYQKLILDQGYWPESLITPPSDKAIKYDIEMTKKMGFNGARKHQKIEDPRYYYWADRLGLLVWGEVPSAYNFNSEEIENITTEFLDFINRDFNHPCIINWVPLNESWGVRNILEDTNQQNFGRALYYMAKAADSTRLVSTNDGWEQVTSDINAIHDYVARGEALEKKYADKDILFEGSVDWRMLYAGAEKYKGQPVLITEYGGIAFTNHTNGEGWGYGYAVKDEEDFFERYEGLLKAIKNTPYIRGYCYTQLTDVLQEVNGLMTPDRKMKVDIERVRNANSL